MADIIEKVAQYKEYLDKNNDQDYEEAKILRAFRKLDRMPITFEILQETGIGKSVNSYRKHGAGVGDQAKALVGKWKQLVSVSSSPPSTASVQCETVCETVYQQTSSGGMKAPYMDSPEEKESRHQTKMEMKKEKQESKEKDEINGKDYKSGSHHKKHKERNDEKGQESREKESKHSSSRNKEKEQKSDRSSSSSSHRNSDYRKEREAKSGKSDSKHKDYNDKERKDDYHKSSKSDRDNKEKLEKGKEKYNGEVGHRREKEKIADSGENKDHKHKSSKEKDRHETKSGEKTSSRDKNKSSSADLKDKNSHSKHKFSDSSSSKSNSKLSSSTLKQSSESPSDSPNISGVKRTLEKSDLDSGDDMDMSNNGGMSFEDMLSMPTVINKKSKKRKVDSSSKSESSSSKSVSSKEKMSESTTESGSSKRYSHKHKKHKSEHREKSSSESSSSKGNKEEKKERSRDRHSSHSNKDSGKLPLDIPPPPKQDVSLSEADIMSTLPSISPNYKPLPYLDIDTMTARQKALEMLDEADIGSKKNTRTQVYSGRKQLSYLTAVPTLYDSCLRVLMDNIDALEFVGGVPYDILKPVLAKCTPQQLYAVEDCNSQFIGDTEELWEVHCKRDFKNRKPDEFETYRELYIRLLDERESKLKKLTANITASMKKATPVRQTMLAYVDSVAKAPREVRRKQIKHGTAGPTHDVDPLSKLTSHGGRENAPKAPAPSDDSSPRKNKQQKQVKMVAPMMAKTLRFMKKLNRR